MKNEAQIKAMVKRLLAVSVILQQAKASSQADTAPPKQTQAEPRKGENNG